MNINFMYSIDDLFDNIVTMTVERKKEILVHRNTQKKCGHVSATTSGTEIAAVGKKRTIDGYAGPQGKRGKPEERGVNPTDTADMDTGQATQVR